MVILLVILLVRILILMLLMMLAMLMILVMINTILVTMMMILVVMMKAMMTTWRYQQTLLIKQRKVPVILDIGQEPLCSLGDEGVLVDLGIYEDVEAAGGARLGMGADLVQTHVAGLAKLAGQHHAAPKW